MSASLLNGFSVASKTRNRGRSQMNEQLKHFPNEFMGAHEARCFDAVYRALRT